MEIAQSFLVYYGIGFLASLFWQMRSKSIARQISKDVLILSSDQKRNTFYVILLFSLLWPAEIILEGVDIIIFLIIKPFIRLNIMIFNSIVNIIAHE